VRARADEQVREEGVVLRQAAAPGAAVHEYIDRRIRAFRREYIQPFDGRRTVDEASRHPHARTRHLAVGCVAAGDKGLVGRIDALIVGVVELLLVQVQPHARALGALRGRLLRERVARCRQHCARRAGTEKFPALICGHFFLHFSPECPEGNLEDA